jgi:RNA polymerase sigma-70 factor (ECF subfamily)
VKTDTSIYFEVFFNTADMDQFTHAEIAQGLRQGSCSAWLKLYELYAEQLWRNVARLMYRDPVSIADVVQETFLAAARSARNFDHRRGSLWIWLWTIAQSQIALHYRKEKTKAAHAKARQWWCSLDGQKANWIDGREKLPAEVLENNEMATLVRHTLAELPAEYQTILTSKYIDGAAIEQIAEQIGSSSEAVRSKLARARKAFRQVFRKLTQLTSRAYEVIL